MSTHLEAELREQPAALARLLDAQRGNAERIAPARSHTNIEMVPGALPLTSISFCDVTSTSAMSALVSDTRAIGVPTSTTVERPTSSLTASASSAA